MESKRKKERERERGRERTGFKGMAVGRVDRTRGAGKREKALVVPIEHSANTLKHVYANFPFHAQDVTRHVAIGGPLDSLLTYETIESAIGNLDAWVPFFKYENASS